MTMMGFASTLATIGVVIGLGLVIVAEMYRNDFDAW